MKLADFFLHLYPRKRRHMFKSLLVWRRYNILEGDSIISENPRDRRLFSLIRKILLDPNKGHMIRIYLKSRLKKVLSEICHLQLTMDVGGLKVIFINSLLRKIEIVKI